MSASVIISLPYPPSANRLWRFVPGKRTPLRSEEYRAWLKEATWAAKAACLRTHDRKGVVGPYALNISACPPDRRKRDLGNLVKAIEDGLKAGGAIEDDSLCQEIMLRWAPDVSGIKATIMSTQFRIPAAAGCAGDGEELPAPSEPASSSPRAPGVRT
jgi:crossover junction endodeoxyribonuclease RusA